MPQEQEKIDLYCYLSFKRTGCRYRAKSVADLARHQEEIHKPEEESLTHVNELDAHGLLRRQYTINEGRSSKE